MNTNLMMRIADKLDAGIITGHDWPNTQDELDRMEGARLLREAALAQRADEPVEKDDLTIAYMVGFQKGQDAKAAPAAPAYVPLSDDDVRAAYRKVFDSPFAPRIYGLAEQFARAIESLVVARMRGEGK